MNTNSQNIMILLLSIIIVNVATGQQNPPRDVLAVPGTFTSSYDWHPQIIAMQNEGYKIREAFSQITVNNNGTPTKPYFDWDASISENVGKLNYTIDNPVHNYNNVLCLGHDVGGLAIRGLKEINSKVNGLILVGTPNRGSNLLRDLQTPNSTTSANLESWLNSLKEWRGRDINCPDCDKPQKLLDFIKAFRDENYGEGAINDPNSYYNTLPNPDPQKTAIIWGNAGTQKLGLFLGSRNIFNIGSTLDFEECAKRLRTIKEANIKIRQLVLKIELVTGFQANILNFVGNLLKDVKDGIIPISNVFTATATYITSQAELRIKEIRESNEINKEQKELLLCELANQRLEAEWQMRLRGLNPQLTTSILANPNYNATLCTQNQYQCNYNQSSPNWQSYCYFASLYCNQTVLTLTGEPTDMVFTKTEQTHPSVTADKTFELNNTNHFQEQFWDKNKGKLEQLFAGDHGESFRVKK